MTTYKEQSERTDADERALIPAIKRTVPAEKPTAIHTEDQLQEHADALKWTRDNEKILAWQRDQARNHADKLAEALQGLITATIDQRPWAESRAIAILNAYKDAQ